MLHGTSEDRPRIEFQVPDRAIVELFVSDQPMPRVEKQNAQHFVLKRPHRRHEILIELRAGGIHRAHREICLKAFESDFPGAEQDRGDMSVIAEDTLKRFGALRENSADAAELL